MKRSSIIKAHCRRYLFTLIAVLLLAYGGYLYLSFQYPPGVAIILNPQPAASKQWQELLFPSEEQIFGLSLERQNLYFFCLGFEANCGFLCVWNFTCIWRTTHNSTYRAVCWAREIQPSPLQFSERAIGEKLLNSRCRTEKRQYRVWLILTVYDQMVDLSFNLVYHLALGIDHVLVYDENTTGMEEMLAPFVKLGLVTYISVSERRSQIPSYLDAHNRSLGLAEWIVYSDVDELLYDFEHRCVHDILSTVPNNVSVFSINRLELHPSLAFSGRELGHTYFSRSRFGSFGVLSHGVKSICRPNHSVLAGVHHCDAHPSYHQVNSNFLKFHGYSTFIENPTMVFLHYRGGDFYEYVRKRIRGAGQLKVWDNRTLNGFVDEVVTAFYLSKNGSIRPGLYPGISDFVIPGFDAISRAAHQLYQDLFIR